MHNFFIQIYGAKRFYLYPPFSWRSLYLFPKFHLQHRNCQVDIHKPNLAKCVSHPLFAVTFPR